MNRPIRVCYIATGVDLGGAPRSLIEMLKPLRESGRVEPYVILRSGGELENRLASLGIPYRLIRFPASIESDSRLKNAVKGALMPYFTERLREVIRAGEFDIVHNNGVMYDCGLRAAQKEGVPCVCHIREYASKENGYTFLNEEQVRESVDNCARVICISKGVANRFSGWFERERCAVLSDGFEVGRYYREHGALFAHTPYKMLLAGHIMRTKGQLQAIQAIELLKERHIDVRLVIVGIVKEGSYYQEIADYANRNGLSEQVEFKEFVDDLSELRAESDISLICSTANEGLGRVTIEGMLAGCLAIGSDKGGTTEIIEDGVTGYLYSATNPISLANCVERAIEDSVLASRIALKGQAYALHTYDSERYADAIIQIYEDILS